VEHPSTHRDGETIAPITHLTPVAEDADQASLLGAAVLAAFGAAALAVDALGRAVRAASGVDERPNEPSTPSGAATAVGAAAALTLAMGRSMAKAAAAAGRGAAFAANVAVEAGPPALRRFRDDVGRRATDLDATWREERSDADEIARRIGAALLPETVAAVLDTLDLTAIVVDRVDLDRVIEEVDLDVAVRRVDIEAVVDRVDLQAIVDRIDLDAVAARIDVDRIVERVDLDGVIERIDVVGIARSVIEQLDLASLIRESTEAVTTESIEGVRVHSANADRYVQHLVDAILRRRPPEGDG
jgi:hypothetical protein